MILKLDIGHQWFKNHTVCINDDPGLTDFIVGKVKFGL